MSHEPDVTSQLVCAKCKRRLIQVRHEIAPNQYKIAFRHATYDDLAREFEDAAAAAAERFTAAGESA